MTAKSDHSDRDPEADAKARLWAEEARRKGGAGELDDDSEFLVGKIAEEKRKLEHR